MKSTTMMLLILLLMSWATQAQNTPGNVTFTVTTKTDGGEYAPKNVIAIWIKDASGTFIRTLKLMAQQQTKYLYQWKASSGLNTIDALTGPTLSSHQTHSVTWNCKSLSNTVVADGDYSIWVEFTEKDSQGPFTSFAFTKSTTPVTINYPNQSKFINVSLTYTPEPIAISEVTVPSKAVVSFLNPYYSFKLPSSTGASGILRIYNLQGQLVWESNTPVISGNSLVFNWDADRKEGIYLYSIVTDSTTYSGKIAHVR